MILAPIQAPQRDRAREIAHGAGGLAQPVIDPRGDAQAVVFGQLRLHRRHGAVAQLRGHVAPEAAIALDILRRIRLQEIDAVPAVAGCGRRRSSAPAPGGWTAANSSLAAAPARRPRAAAQQGLCTETSSWEPRPSTACSVII